jgi:hypothetical protein
MTATDIIAATTLTVVWTWFGGDPPHGGRARAFWSPSADKPQAVKAPDSCRHNRIVRTVAIAPAHANPRRGARVHVDSEGF